MKLIDLNADGGIGANSLYVPIGDFHLVIDSGLHPKKVGRVAAPNLRPLEGVQLDLIIITHCHLDHIGIAAQGIAEFASDLRDLEGVRESSPREIRLSREHHL